MLSEIARGFTDVDQLAGRFGVSASTIRRDLQALSAQQAVTRTFGGALLTRVQASSAEDNLMWRRGQNREAKLRIAAAALKLVRHGERLLLDGGSTVEAMGAGLRSRHNMVITNNLPLVTDLVGAPDVEVVVLGGTVRPISLSTTGFLAEQALRRMTADRCFLGADGVVAGRGLCEASLPQVSLKSLMMAQSAETVVLADASKLGRTSQSYWAELGRDWILITDDSAGADELAPFEQLGVRVIVA